MTVSIDPSEIRRQAAAEDTVKAAPRGRRLSGPARTLVLGGLGGASLLAFTIGAFSFFGGLADPRVRPNRPTPVAAKMPDLKDGLPALVSEGNGAGGGAAPAATVLNLPKPPAPEPSPETASAKAEDAPRPGLPAADPAAAPAVAAIRPTEIRSVSSDATGSVARKVVATPRAKAGPGIENAATVSGDARPAPLIAPARTAGPLAPAKAETVRAKLAALPAEPSPSAAAHTPAGRQAAAQESEAEPKPAPAKKPAQKVARAKAKPTVEASAEPASDPAPAPAAEPEEGFSAKVDRGIKAIGGLFGRD